MAVDRESRLAVLRTKGGNLVGVALDSRNRMFLFDRVSVPLFLLRTRASSSCCALQCPLLAAPSA